MYCRKCHRIYEPEVPGVLQGERLSIRTMLTAAYLKTGIRMSLENVSITMRKIFSMKISEGEIQDIDLSPLILDTFFASFEEFKFFHPRFR